MSFQVAPLETLIEQLERLPAIGRKSAQRLAFHVLELPLEEDIPTGFSGDCAPWLKPYLTAAMRSGLMTGWVKEDSFQENKVITGAEAATMIQNALDLAEPMALSQENLTRAEAAMAIYQVAQMKENAPGLAYWA